ncbi:MAG: nucleotide-binding protein [Candidatus Omnitrophica bacterium]|nr:nucleotide-binding protein [Candidatus Omnitrophota bacterium]
MKKKLINQIRSLLDEGEKFTFSNFCYPHNQPDRWGGEDKPEWLAWKTRSYNFISQIAAPNSSAQTLAETAIGISTSGNYPKEFERLKETMIKALKLAEQSIRKDSFGELKKQSIKTTSTKFSNKIFVVHGHDHTLKAEVESFLNDIGLEPIILHKKPDEGQTIIEKFEKHSDVGYAFVLLTPDEIAYTIDQDSISDQKRKKEKRTRPNVIFEFGYFAGRLGRNRVCCVYKESVAVPSDLKGFLYKEIKISFKEKAYEIMQELSAAGYKIKFKNS